MVTARQIYSSSSAVRRGARLSKSMPKFSSVCLSCSVSSPVSVTGCGNSPSHSPNTSTAAMSSNRRVAAEPTVTQSCRAGTAPMSVSSKYSSSAADSSSADRSPSSPGNSVDMSASAPVSRFHSRTVSPASRVLPSRSSVSAGDQPRLSLTPSPLRYPNSALLCSAGVSATATVGLQCAQRRQNRLPDTVGGVQGSPARAPSSRWYNRPDSCSNPRRTGLTFSSPGCATCRCTPQKRPGRSG